MECLKLYVYICIFKISSKRQRKPIENHNIPNLRIFIEPI